MLRDYQLKGVKELRLKLENNNKVLLYLSTGAGKTKIAQEIINLSIKNKKKVLFMVKRRKLVEQTSERFKNINHAIIMSGHKSVTRPVHDLYICSVDTLYSRRSSLNLLNIELIIIDEAHDCTSKSYQEVLSLFKGIKTIGLTATPFKINGKYHAWWDDYVEPITCKELIKQGHLVPFKAFVPKGISKRNLQKNSSGDYTDKSMMEAVDEPQLYSSFEKEFDNHAVGYKTIIFCVNIKHAETIEENLCSKFAPVYKKNENVFRIDSSISSIVIEEIYRKIQVLNRENEPYVIVNVNMCSVGLDIPELQVGMFLRPTASLCLWYQQIGRLMRPAPYKKHARLVDFTCNTFDFQLPSTVHRLPEMKEEPKHKRVSGIKSCPNCFFINPSSAKTCEYCCTKFGSETIGDKTITWDDSIPLTELKNEMLDKEEMDEYLRKLNSQCKTLSPQGQMMYIWTRMYKKFGGQIMECYQIPKLAERYFERVDKIKLDF